MDVVIICVPTPLNEYHEPDLSYVTGTVRSLAPYVHEGQLIILESTTYPGTTEEVMVPLLEQGNPSGLKVARDASSSGFYVAFSPEREDPGNDTVARRDIPKVVGGCGPIAPRPGLRPSTARSSIAPSPSSSPAAAEMTKLLENIYRCVNIALVNELKQLCMRMGIDTFEVIDAAKTKLSAFRPSIRGPAWVAIAFPSIPSTCPGRQRSLTSGLASSSWRAKSTSACPTSSSINVVEAMSQQGKALRGSRVLILGMAYKRDIDDLRESPSLTIIEVLQKRGAQSLL